jgi:predicted ArsR family transcriptional regulator
MKDGYVRGSLPRTRTARQVDVLAAYVAAGGSVSDAAARVGIRPSTAKRQLADLRARSGLTTEQLIYRRHAEGWLVVPGLEAD